MNLRRDQKEEKFLRKTLSRMLGVTTEKQLNIMCTRDRSSFLCLYIRLACGICEQNFKSVASRYSDL